MKIAIASKRTIVAVAVTVVLIAAAIASVTVTDSACVYLGRSPRLLPIYSVEREDKVVALTFDAAWGADKTPDIIGSKISRQNISGSIKQIFCIRHFYAY